MLNVGGALFFKLPTKNDEDIFVGIHSYERYEKPIHLDRLSVIEKMLNACRCSKCGYYNDKALSFLGELPGFAMDNCEECGLYFFNQSSSDYFIHYPSSDSDEYIIYHNTCITPEKKSILKRNKIVKHKVKELRKKKAKL